VGITKFADGTQTLNRFYKAIDENGKPCITIATLHILHPDGRAETILDHEDFLLHQFTGIAEWTTLYEQKHGLTTAFSRVTSPEQCNAFFPNGEGQFSISKTGMKMPDGTPIQNNIIHGRFLQLGNDNQPVIQDPNASILEELIYNLHSMPPPKRPAALNGMGDIAVTLSQDGLNAHAWLGRDVESIVRIPNALKIGLENAHFIDTGRTLTLYGNAEDKYLRAMVQHAQENWGNTFNIDSGSAEVRASLKRIASDRGMTVTETNPAISVSPPSRPGTPQRGPFTNVQHAAAA
jgi:Large polyvalent protein-associated domain 7